MPENNNEPKNFYDVLAPPPRSESAPINSPPEVVKAGLGQTALDGQQKPKKSRKKLFIILAIVLVVLLAAGGTAYAFTRKKTTSSSSSDSINTSTAAASSASTLPDSRTFVRYADEDAYEKDSAGKTKEIIEKDGSHVSVRKKSFYVTLEADSKKTQIPLTDTTYEFGVTTTGNLYALSCSVPDVKAVGADNASFTIQYYDKNGNKLTQATWKQQDTTRPESLGDYCISGYFSVKNSPVDTTARGYGRTHIDDLNYKTVYVKSDGSTQDVSKETAAVIDTPLGASPDGKIFLYNRVSAKRTVEGCGEPVTIPYKIIDFSGPVNELHSFNLTTKTDTLVGTEKSFSVTKHEINLNRVGTFSADSGRYYLSEGGHGGCRGGDSIPIRIAYINLKTNKLETIVAPTGKDYSDYCLTKNGKFALESGVVDDFDDKTPAKPVPAPTVLNLNDSSTYQADELTKAYGCDGSLWWKANTFTAITLSKPDNYNKSNSDNSLVGFQSFNPATKKVEKVTFSKPLDIKNSYIQSIQPLSNGQFGYVNRSPQTVGSLSPIVLPTVIFNMNTGEVKEVPYANIVL